MMRETLLTGCANSSHYVSYNDLKKARHRVAMTLAIDPIDAEWWLDRITGSLLQYYVLEKGHPITEKGYNTIQQILSPHYHTVIKALNIILKEAS